MSKIEELIKELCPNGVKFEMINKVVDLYYGKGNTIPKDGGNYPVYGCYGIVGYTSTYNNENTPIVGHIGSAGKVSWGRGQHFVTYNGTICKTRNKNILNSRYLYHILLNLKLENCVKGSQPFLSISDFGTMKIPTPPLEVQEEIVRILDKFGELEVELEAELEARKSQYEFWRGKLLNIENSNQKYITLGDIGKVCMCKRIMKNETSDSGDVPFYKIGTFGKQADAYISYNIFNDYKKRFSYPKKGEILVSCSGTIGRTVVFDGEDAYFQDSNIVWLSNNESKVLNKFLYYFYQTLPWNVSDGGTIKRLYNNQFKSAKVPLYSLEGQKRIVSILESFDKLVNDISEGLPAEIEARRKQYEYYRNKLLSFEELVVNE